MATMKIGSFPTGASPYGVLDTSGNVCEWTNSIHKSYGFSNVIQSVRPNWLVQAAHEPPSGSPNCVPRLPHV